MHKNLLYVINATAPIRICDLGGWTDTWFAEYGAVLNIGVYPYAEVQIYVYETDIKDKTEIVLDVENFGERYTLQTTFTEYDKHPLLEACIDIMNLPSNLSFEVNLFSEAPAGCSTGTSASISVALLGALDMLTPGQHTPHEIASLAHRVETEKLGLQCGIQDQICASYGGICFIEMFRYPHASVSPVMLPNSTWWELERRLMLVYLGKTHSSSDIHKQVITRLEQPQSDKSVLDILRDSAHKGKNALLEGNFITFAKAMIQNTEGQMALHPSLVSDLAKQVIDLAKQHRAIGWKVNGAGGEGGSLTLLFDEHNKNKRTFKKALTELNPQLQIIPIYLSRMGLRRWFQQK